MHNKTQFCSPLLLSNVTFIFAKCFHDDAHANIIMHEMASCVSITLIWYNFITCMASASSIMHIENYLIFSDTYMLSQINMRNCAQNDQFSIPLCTWGSFYAFPDTYMPSQINVRIEPKIISFSCQSRWLKMLILIIMPFPDEKKWCLS